MRNTVVVSLLVLLCASGALASCLNDFVTCVSSGLPIARCARDIQQCATNQCACLDIASAGSVMCRGNYTFVQHCMSEVKSVYGACIASCKTNATGVHAAPATVMSIFPHWSKAEICQKVVTEIEKFANTKGCGLIDLDFSIICDVLAPVCYLMFKKICAEALSIIENHPGISPADVCADLGFGPSSTLIASTPASTASMITVNSAGMGEFYDRFMSLPYAGRASTTANCWPVEGVADQYNCMESIQVTAAVAPAPTPTPTPSTSGSSSSGASAWAVVGGVFACLTFLTALAILYVVKNKNNQVNNPAYSQGYARL